MSDTARLKLPLLAPAQAQKHLTLNEALSRIDAAAQAAVATRALATPPPDPAEGEAYLVPDGASGAFAGHEGEIAAFLAGGWLFLAAPEGFLVHVADEARFLVRRGGAWTDLLEAAVLFPAGGGHHLKINRPAPTGTAALLLATGHAGNFEIGLAGDGDLLIKASADGTAFSERMRLPAAGGPVVFSGGSLRQELTGFTTNGTWQKPAFARWVRIMLVGGGGGGGSGRYGISLTDQRGGGGGAAGSVVIRDFLAGELPESLTVTLATGGIGGIAPASPGFGQSGGAGGTTQVLAAGLAILNAPGGRGGNGGGPANMSAAQGAIGYPMVSAAGGPGQLTSGSPPTETDSPFSAGGGGGGGGLLADGSPAPGGNGGTGYQAGAGGPFAAPGGAGGTAGGPGQAGTTSTRPEALGGGGGGGSNGASGGAGGYPGAGGGGGGGGSPTSGPGGGGQGGGGYALFVATG